MEEKAKAAHEAAAALAAQQALPLHKVVQPAPPLHGQDDENKVDEDVGGGDSDGNSDQHDKQDNQESENDDNNENHIDGEEAWEVEEILSERVVRRKREYRVKWAPSRGKIFPPSWEPEEGLQAEWAIEEFKKKKQANQPSNKKQKRKRRRTH